MTQETEKPKYITKIAYDADLNPLYIGQALVKSESSASAWRIKKIVYDANLNPIAIEWANESTAFDKVWDDRASYAYGF